MSIQLPEPQRMLVVFHLAGQLVALPLENVESIAPMARLARPPGLPCLLEGILNVSGEAIPVVRLDRLLQLPERRPGLYSMLIVLRGVSDRRTALLVDRVTEILPVPESGLLAAGEENSFNGCAEGVVSVNDRVIHILSPARILLEKERQALSEFQAMAQRRVQEWEPLKV